MFWAQRAPSLSKIALTCTRRPKDQNKHTRNRAARPSPVSSEQEQTYTNSRPLVEEIEKIEFFPSSLKILNVWFLGDNVYFWGDNFRRRTNVQQLTCNIDLSNYFYYLFFSFVLIELKPFVLKGRDVGEKLWKSVKMVKKCEKWWNDFALQLLPFGFSLLLFTFGK